MTEPSDSIPPEQPLAEEVVLTVIDLWKLRTPSIYIPLPPELISHVGGVVIAWGMFEKALEFFLTAVLHETAKTYKGWQRFSLTQRCEILRTEAAVCFADCADLLGRLFAFMDDIEPLQIKRNALVHGTLSLQLIPVALIATYQHQGQPIQITLTKDQIDDLYYELIYLAGRMNQFSDPATVSFEPPLSSPDKSRLLDVLSRNPLPPSNPSMIARPPAP